MALQRAEWTDVAACRGIESHLFFPPDAMESREVRSRRERQAKQVCADCHVREECLSSALTQRESYGIWGGLTEVERRSLLRR
ncbi:MAG: WhiB family transcriptional regulator [Acidobacteria bacterium]|nr:WhiB family transcriptional regulator [Acidobacteriota bacterium]